MKGGIGKKKKKKEAEIHQEFSKEGFCTADHKDRRQPQNEKQLPRGPFARASKVMWFMFGQKKKKV